MNKIQVINEIKEFLEGYNDLKYLVHVEGNYNTNEADCVIHPPGEEKRIVKMEYTPFLYIKDLKKNGIELYNGDQAYYDAQLIQHGVHIVKQKTGNQKRLEDGYCYKAISYKSFNHLLRFFREGGLNPYEKQTDEEGNIQYRKDGRAIMPNRKFFFTLKTSDQFLVDKKIRLFKGFEEYKDVHKVVFDIETTGLRPEISRMFSIGVRDNMGFETILSVDKLDDDDAEANLIRDFFNLISILNPAIIAGYNSEDFDFPYILGRAKILNVDLTKLPTTLNSEIQLKRRPNSSVKIGNSAEKYTATEMWGMSVIDIMFAAKKTVSVNSDLKNSRLKYIAKYEGVARDNRTYIPGEDNDIGRYYHENNFFMANENNEYIEVPKEFQNLANHLVEIKNAKGPGVEESLKKQALDDNPDFVVWYRKECAHKKMNKFVQGKKLVNQYLLDDLFETAEIDELYNQSSFMLAKIVPTTYDKICTIGTAGIWNLLLTAWSHHHGLAIPHPDVKKKFSGGLARCYKIGFSQRIIKIDYASLYPFEQLTWDIFPLFDITGVLKKMLMYMTTTRNIYKKLAISELLNEEEIKLMESIDHETYLKDSNNLLVDKDRKGFKIKQLPIKILNNSQFGALGADVAFNWSDNTCASRITGNGRLDLRQAISWFSKFGCVPLLAVTDGVNFHIPDTTTIMVTNEGITEGTIEGTIEEMWQYNDKVGIAALIEKFNSEEMIGEYMSVDNDGEFISCLNLSRINYALLQEYKDKKTGEIKTKVKLTGNTIKSKVMPEYIEEFFDKGIRLILEGKGDEFVDYYYDYIDNLYYKQIPLKKIATKNRYKHTLKQYMNRGNDKNGRKKAKQAHMELIIMEREKIAEKLFEEHKGNLEFKKAEEKLTIKDKLKLVSVFMPPEPELDSTLYFVNTGYRKSHGNSKMIKDEKTKEERFASTLISSADLIENPNMLGEYNVDKYLDAFNERIATILVGFDPDVAERIPAKIIRKKEKDINGKMEMVETLKKEEFTKDELCLRNFDSDEFDESMHLEQREVDFWNETGFDPRLVWDGFKMRDDMLVYYEIYENALKYLNEKMLSAGKPLIKSRNEKINKGDYVLIKSGSEYDIGYHTGEYIETIRFNVPVPKSEIEIKLDRIRDEEAKKIKENLKNLENPDMKSEVVLTLEQKSKKRMEHFESFKERFEIPIEVNYGKFMTDAGVEGTELIDQFIDAEEKRINNEANQYMSSE